jgi:hypothetical protein
MMRIKLIDVKDERESSLYLLCLMNPVVSYIYICVCVCVLCYLMYTKINIIILFRYLGWSM